MKAINTKDQIGIHECLHVICDIAVRYAPSVGSVALLRAQTQINAEMRVRLELERENEEKQKKARPRITKNGTERVFRAGAYPLTYLTTSWGVF